MMSPRTASSGVLVVVIASLACSAGARRVHVEKQELTLETTEAKANSSAESGLEANSSFCGFGCVMCPPGTHDAGTCQPSYDKCGYNGIIGEMLEHVDHCGGPAEGNPMMGGGMGGNMWNAGMMGGGMMGNPMMGGGMMGNPMMGGGMMGNPMMGGGMMGNPMMGGGMMGGGMWLQTKEETQAEAKTATKAEAKENSSTEAGVATNSSFCGFGCVMCPPGTHDAGTCQPSYDKCGYNGIIGEMLEHVDHCGGPAEGNPMMGGGMGGNMWNAGMMGGNPMMGGGMMGNPMMGGGMMGGGMMGGHPMMGGGMMGNPMMGGGMMGGGMWLQTKEETKAEAKAATNAEAKENATSESGLATNSSFCGFGCVLCPPGTHDAGTCQPSYDKCGYNGIIGEMLEHVDHCGGPAEGNPMMGGGMGGNMWNAGMMGGNPMMGGGMMGNPMMGGGMMGGGMMGGGMMGGHPMMGGGMGGGWR